MTNDERALVLALAKVWDGFLELPSEHDDDTQEFWQGIHAVQRIILARSGRREINGYRHL